ncbi:MAG TPA: hypothetical protein VKF42_01705, partial [Chitinivibrionales bacterium]|nr:hypothetical protein [Chitinivibrionales bacterium]
MNSIMYRNGSFVFNVSSPVQASANLYDLAGRMVAKIFNGRLIQGSTRVPFSFNRPGRTMLVLRAKIGDASVISIVNPAAGADFAINQQSKANGTLAKTAALDWLQASKAGYASYMQTIDAYSGVINITLAALAGAPNFGPNTKIFDPTMSMATIQSTMDALHNSTGEFSTQRTAYLFKPGNYSLNIRVRYYIQAYGMGMSPEDVQVTGTVEATEDGTVSFWRGVEGFSVTPTGGQAVWAVSQADPFRRMHVKGALLICNSGASGGFISDSKIDGAITTDCAQQFYIRNSVVNGAPTSGIWNFMFQGCDNPPAENWPSGGINVVAKTPLVREKPYLVFDNTLGLYSVFVPALRTDCQGTTWYNATPAGELMPIDQFYIALAGTDNATTINAALAQGKNLILTPGIYVLSTPILVQRPGTVVLG